MQTTSLPFWLRMASTAMACLTGLTVADNQLPLSPANGEHGVDGQNPRSHGAADALAVHDSRRGVLNGPGIAGGDLPSAVDGAPQGVDNPAQQLLSHGYARRLAGAPDGAALTDVPVLVKEDAPCLILPQVLDHARMPLVNSRISP